MKTKPEIRINRSKTLAEEPETGHNRWHPDIPPVIRCDPGEDVILETRDAFDGQFGRQNGKIRRRCWFALQKVSDKAVQLGRQVRAERLVQAERRALLEAHGPERSRDRRRSMHGPIVWR